MPSPTARRAGWRDASLPLSAALPPIPGDPPFARRLFLRHETDGCEAAAWSLSAHAGTHIDFPAHFFPHGKRAGDYPLDAFFLPAAVVDCGQARELGPELLDGCEAGPGEAVLLRTVNSTERLFCGPAFPEAFAAATPALARACVRRGLALVGIDALSIEPLADPAFPVHHILLGAAIRILEGLFLADIAPGRYRLACPPPHVPEAEAAPVRAALGPLP
ncbi:MAG: cyclase family protein [Solidesulfovibrio sp.]|uniref:cyclase family protein n=1 Tax=Solidesulfovibrio sp. TaxID=2910990 RepID=UPI002B1FD790|nr:cyclase family protein [Solidesulfovibrio sp.]MEA4857056.1 cyclase family protein [Solidesulfovibrio sp.]